MEKHLIKENKIPKAVQEYWEEIGASNQKSGQMKVNGTQKGIRDI